MNNKEEGDNIQNIVQSIKKLSLDLELSDFVNKVNEISHLKNAFNEKIKQRKEENELIIQQTLNLSQNSDELTKEYENLYYQIYLTLSYYEDTSYEYFVLFEKQLELAKAKGKTLLSMVNTENLDLDRSFSALIKKFNSITELKGQLSKLQHRLTENAKMHKQFLDSSNTNDSILLLLNTIDEKMKLINTRITFIEENLANEQVVTYLEDKQLEARKNLNQKKHFPSSSSSATTIKQKQKWKEICSTLKFRSRPCYSLQLFDEYYPPNENEVTKAPRHQPKPKTEEELKQLEIRKAHAKLYYSTVLESEASSSSEAKPSAEFLVKSPELGDWSYIHSPENTSSTSGVPLTRTITPLSTFDDNKSPLRNALDKVNQLSYTKVIKELQSTPPVPPPPPAASSRFSSPPSIGLKYDEDSASKNSEGKLSFNLTGGNEKTDATKPARKTAFDFSETTFAVGPEDNNNNNKINNNLNIKKKLPDEGAGGELGGLKLSSLNPETSHSPLALPSLKPKEKNPVAPSTNPDSKASIFAAPTQSSATSTSDSLIDQIKDIYKTYNPEKLNEVPNLLKKYEGRHEELLQKLQNKYVKNPNPAVSTPATKSSPAPSAANSSLSTPAPAGSLFGNKLGTTTPATTTPATATVPPSFSLLQPGGGGGAQPSSLFGNNANAGGLSNSLFSPAPAATAALGNQAPANNTNNTAGNKFYPIILEIYQKYNPQKIEEITSFLQKYEGKELELITKLKKKYNITEPIQAEKGLFAGTGGGQQSVFGQSAPSSSLFTGGGVAANKSTPFQGFNSPAPAAQQSVQQSTAFSTPSNSLFNGAAASSTPWGNNNNIAANPGFTSAQSQTPMSNNNNSLFNAATAGTNSLFGGGGGGGAKSPFANANTVTAGLQAPTLTPGFGMGGLQSQQPQQQQQQPGLGGFGINNNNPAGFSSPFQQQQQHPQQNSLFHNTNNTNMNDVRARVHEIYKNFNPTKIAEIPKLLEKYQGKEHELIQKLEQKYGAATGSTNGGGMGLQNNMMMNSNANALGGGFGLGNNSNSNTPGGGGFGIGGGFNQINANNSNNYGSLFGHQQTPNNNAPTLTPGFTLGGFGTPTNNGPPASNSLFGQTPTNNTNNNGGGMFSGMMNNNNNPGGFPGMNQPQQQNTSVLAAGRWQFNDEDRKGFGNTVSSGFGNQNRSLFGNPNAQSGFSSSMGFR